MRSRQLHQIRFVGFCIFLVIAASVKWAMAQQISALNVALDRFDSPDPGSRVRAFDNLLALAAPASGTIPSQVSALIAQNPEQTDRIETTLIAALDRDSTYVRGLESSGGRMSEEFSSYWSNLMWTVAAFRDPRAVNGLLGGVDTGEIAVNGLADLCPSSVNALVAESTTSQVSSRRRAAVVVLGECMKRLQSMTSSGEAISKMREASMNATNDPNPEVREAATKALFYFRTDPAVRTRLAQLSATDPYQEGYENFRARPGRLVVREAAASVLAAPVNDDDYYFVMRTPGARACTIQKGSERPQPDRYIGPESTRDRAQQMLCTHVDTARRNQNLCWDVQPANACGAR